MERSVAIIGAGKIGRGYLADLFGDAGYHLVFINSSTGTSDKLNAAGKYTLFTTDDKGTREKVISDFEAYSSQRDFDTVVKRLSEVELICVALYPEAYPSVADQLAGAIRFRVKAGSKDPMNIFFFVNKVFTARTMKKLLLERLQTDAEKAFFANNVGLVESLTFRGGYNPTAEMLAKDPLCISSSEGRVLPVGDNFVGPRPDVPSMQFVDRAEGRLVRKVWCGNMRHCTLAAMGRLKGYTYTFESAADQYIRKCVDYASAEANFGVGQEFGFTPQEMREGVRIDWKSMMNTKSKDDLFRVAADPLRKLSRDDRFIGPALLCLRHGRLPYYLARGAAHEFMFENEKDPSAVELQRIVGEKGIEQAIWEVCGLDPKDRDDAVLHQLILAAYRDILDHDVDPATV
jgi:mannitol-1-phosphate 5-dehydrogenase